MARGRDEEEGYHELASDGYDDLPRYSQPRRCCTFSWPVVVTVTTLVLLIGAIVTAGVVFYPTPPDVEVKEWKVNGISIDSKDSKSILPAYQLNVSLAMVVEIANPNYVGLVYKDVTVRIVYKGGEVGQVQSEGERVPARSVANLTATVELEGNEILDNWKALVQDYQNGTLPLTTYSTFDGSLKLLFLKPRLKVTVACDLVLNPKNATVLSQECGL